MNRRMISAALIVLSFLISSLLLASSAHLAFRSQGQNSIHTVLQQTKIHRHALAQPHAEINTPITVEKAPAKTETPAVVQDLLPQPSIAAETPKKIPLLDKKTVLQEKPKEVINQTKPVEQKKVHKVAPTKSSTEKRTAKHLKDTPSTLITPKKGTQKILHKNINTQKESTKKTTIESFVTPGPVNKELVTFKQVKQVQEKIVEKVKEEKNTSIIPEKLSSHQEKTFYNDWIHRAKKGYNKSINYLKELLKPKTKTSETIALGDVQRKNAVSEVQSIESIDGTPISGSFMMTPEIMRSFRPQALSKILFGNDLYTNTSLHIRGSALTRNNAKDWISDYFYLSNAYESVITFSPQVTSFLADFSLYLNLDDWFKGCFLRVQTPLTWTKWDLDMREEIINSGKVAGAQGWRGRWTSVNNRLLSSFTDYAAWEKAGTSYIDNVGIAHPLYLAKFCPHGLSKTGLADIHVDFGVHEHQAEHYKAGFYLRTVIPTGTKPDGEWFFEPIIGNGRFWELGGGIYGYAELWKNTNRGYELGLYGDCAVTHLFSSHQKRVFDLKEHGPLSRYLLLTNSATAPSSLTPAANITRTEVTINVPAQVDLTVLLNCVFEVFSWDIGYNFWSRSCEKVSCEKASSSSVCNNCAESSGLDGITWKPYANSTLKDLGSATLAPALTLADLDINASRAKGHTHKLFTALTYAWTDLDEVVVPFLGIGAEVELGKTAHTKVETCCTKSALTQWGLWLRTGTEF